MTLADRFKNVPVDPSLQFCTVGKTLSGFAALDGETGDDYVALVAALQDPTTWTATDIARLCGLEGIDVDVRHIRQHRNGEHRLRNCAAHDAGTLT